MSDRLQLGFEILVIPDAGGKFVYYPSVGPKPSYGTGYADPAPRWTGLGLASATADGWYSITEGVYAGLTVGAYSTSYEAVGGDYYGQSSGVSPPGGLAVHAALGYLEPPRARGHFLFFAEAAFLYHGGSGTLETAPGRIEEVSGPSGLGLFAGVTF